MKFEDMKQGCSLFNCNLVDDGTDVVLEFPKVSVRLAKDFRAEETEVILFVVKGWLGVLQEVLADSRDNEQSCTRV